MKKANGAKYIQTILLNVTYWHVHFFLFKSKQNYSATQMELELQKISIILLINQFNGPFYRNSFVSSSRYLPITSMHHIHSKKMLVVELGTEYILIMLMVRASPQTCDRSLKVRVISSSLG